jgi:urease accessory protein
MLSNLDVRTGDNFTNKHSTQETQGSAAKGTHTMGSVDVLCVNGKSVVASMRQAYPLKFLALTQKTTQQQQVQWVYEVNYGGGLVSGDTITINMKVGAHASAVITGQSSMKIYKAKNKGDRTQHHLNANVERGALLCMVFPPVTCFAEAEYEQSQTVHLADLTSNVIIVEWATSGRMSTGESWDFSVLQTKSEVWLGSDLLVRDAVRLSNMDGPPTVRERMHPYKSMATFIIVGERLLNHAEHVYGVVSKMQVNRCNQKSGPPNLVCSASLLKSKNNENHNENTVGCVVKVAAHTTAQVLEFVNMLFRNTWAELIGEDPYK